MWNNRRRSIGWWKSDRGQGRRRRRTDLMKKSGVGFSNGGIGAVIEELVLSRWLILMGSRDMFCVNVA